MFDIGFSELLIIGVVALLVIGPERLPKVARTAGAWLGRLNRYVSDVKGDIDREMRLEELRNLQNEMKASAQKYEIMAEEAGQAVKREAEGIDKMVKAMAATDEGLSQKEFERIRSELTPAEPSGAEAEAVPPPSEAEPEPGPHGVEEDKPRDRAA